MDALSMRSRARNLCTSEQKWGSVERFVGHMVRQAALRRGGAAEAGARRAWDTAHHG